MSVEALKVDLLPNILQLRLFVKLNKVFLMDLQDLLKDQRFKLIKIAELLVAQSQLAFKECYPSTKINQFSLLYFIKYN